MIINYDIKSLNNEEILYLYLDFKYEFGSFKNKRFSIINLINEYIRNMNIKFNGKRVVLVVGGVVIGSLFLFNNSYSNLETFTNNSVLNYVVNKSINKKLISEKKEEEKEEVSSENIVKESSIKSSKKTSETVSKKSEISNQSKIENNVSSNSSNTIDSNSSNSNSNVFMVSVYRSSGTESIEFNDYLIGVVSSEMPAEFNIEALKAQSVVSRTYALKSLASGKRLTDSISTQVYKDNSELKKLWGSNYDKYYPKVKSAVLLTEEKTVKYNNKYIDAVFHSCSDKYTEDSIYVWGNSIPYLKSVSSLYDRVYSNSVFYSYDDLSKLLGYSVNNDTSFSIRSYTVSNRVNEFSINDKIYSGVDIRNLFSLKSTSFTYERTNEGIKFNTLGYGHGVGMSQYGANGMAKNGSSYIDILKHYYTGVSIS